MKDTEVIDLHFPKLNHFWLDAGLLGLYRICGEVQKNHASVNVNLESDGVNFNGTWPEIHALLMDSYELLIRQYYNCSTQKQKEKNENFYYATAKKEFVRFPKKGPTCIANLMAGKPSLEPGVSKVESIKDRGKFILPKDFSSLQEELDSFLEKTSLKLYGNKNALLINGENLYKPNLSRPLDRFRRLEEKIKGNCFLCGKSSPYLDEIKTTFPVIAGKNGTFTFTSQCRDSEKVCWKCSFLGKFVPATGYYVFNNKKLHMFFPYSTDLKKINTIVGSLESIKYSDPDLYRNFDNPLGGYFQRNKAYELTFAFIFSVYRHVFNQKSASAEPDEEIYELDYEKMFNIMISYAPVTFFMMETESLGDAQMGKMIWEFNEAVYFFRLMEEIEAKINIKNFMTQLVDYDQPKPDNRTIMRNWVCERILKKRSVLELIEQHAFKINKSEDKNIRCLYEFVMVYESIIREDKMDDEARETAVTLGKQIGMSVQKGSSGKKGDLFALRKSRKFEDFLNEINRIQFKYDVLIPAEVYNGHLTRENFVEFKQFCMLAALNSFNSGKFHNEEKKDE